MKHSTQLVTLSAQRLAYGSMPLGLAETRPRSNFPESRDSFSEVRSAKLNTDVTILMPGTDYFGETALKTMHPIPINTMRISHTFAALIQAYIPGGGGRGYLTKFNTGRLRPEVQPLTLSYTILAEKVPLLYTFHRKNVPLSHTYCRKSCSHFHVVK